MRKRIVFSCIVIAALIALTITPLWVHKLSQRVQKQAEPTEIIDIKADLSEDGRLSANLVTSGKSFCDLDTKVLDDRLQDTFESGVISIDPTQIEVFKRKSSGTFSLNGSNDPLSPQEGVYRLKGILESAFAAKVRVINHPDWE
jgi:hypothetical protein